MEGWTNSILRAESKQQSKSKREVSASADFTKSAPLYKNYPMLTKTHQFQTMGLVRCFQTHVHVCFCWGIREGGHPEQGTTPSVSLDSHMEKLYGVQMSHAPPPLLPLLHLVHDPMSITGTLSSHMENSFVVTMLQMVSA